MSRSLSSPPNSWADLRRWTGARIALGRAGGSLRTDTLLDFRLAHARARDAVRAEFRVPEIVAALDEAQVPNLVLQTLAQDRAAFLLRPDQGRQLDPASAELLVSHGDTPADVVLLLSDGLSATAAHAHGVETIARLRTHLTRMGRRVFPIIVAPFARVKLQDQVGDLLGARQTVILLGERPGLGAPDSLGAYLTFRPGPTTTDADRNCVSNIRESGLPPDQAAIKLAQLLAESDRLGFSGVKLKDSNLPPLP